MSTAILEQSKLGSKVKVIAQIGSKLAYLDVAVQDITHNTIGTPLI